MTTLRDALEGAFEAAETGNLETVGDPPDLGTDPPDTSSESSETAPRNRDDSGRFASKAEEVAEEVVAEAKTQRKPPSSWKKDYWGQWDKLATDPELSPLQDYIEQRENEFAKGVSTYREEAIKAKDLQDTVAPYSQILQQHGLNPAQHVRTLLEKNHALAMGTPEQKAQVAREIIAATGLPLSAIFNNQIDAQTAQQWAPQQQLLQELNQIKTQFSQFAQTAQQREQAELADSINAFRQNAPHFEEVRETMAGLLQSGHASDLKTAYDKACRLNDNVWVKVQSEQTAQSQRDAAQRAQAKKAAAVSTRSSAPTGQKVAVNGNDIRSTLESAFNAVAGGRL